MSYALTTSDCDPSTFVTIEHWRSQQDADHRVTTDQMAVATATALTSTREGGVPERSPSRAGAIRW